MLQELKNFIVLVMELCDYDLDHLVKVSPFKEDSTIVFLYQLGTKSAMSFIMHMHMHNDYVM